MYWCNVGPIYSQCLANENILGIYWTNIVPMNCAFRDIYHLSIMAPFIRYKNFYTK